MGVCPMSILQDIGLITFDLLLLLVTNPVAIIPLAGYIILFASIILILLYGILNLKSLVRFFGEKILKIKNYFSDAEQDETEEKQGLSSDLVDVISVALIVSVIFSGILFGATALNSNFQPEWTAVNERIDPTQMPVQIPAEKQLFNIKKDKNYVIFPFSRYEISGIVVAKNTFLFDTVKNISPVDIGLIYGELARPEYRKDAVFFLSFMRHLMPHFRSGIKLDNICAYYSHNHIIPSNNNILKAVKSLKNNQTVMLKGYLVYVNTGGCSNWGSPNMIPGACDSTILSGCEIIYVDEVRTDGRVYK